MRLTSRSVRLLSSFLLPWLFQRAEFLAGRLGGQFLHRVLEISLYAGCLCELASAVFFKFQLCFLQCFFMGDFSRVLEYFPLAETQILVQLCDPALHSHRFAV